MSKKQKADLDDGYVRIANSIMQALYTLPISNREMRVLLFILYQTYGYNHKERELSNSYIGQGVGITRSHANEAVKKLIARKIIKQALIGKRNTQTLSINTKLNEWVTVPDTGNRTVPEMSDTEIGNSSVPDTGNRTVPETGKQYNTDQYQLQTNTKQSVGATANAAAPTPKFCNFERLWSEWKYSQAGKERITKKQREEIENNGYLRMADAAERYYRDFDSRPTLNNQPLSARTWFSGAYVQYLPPVDEATRIWYDVDGHKCKGERRYV